MNKKKIAIIFAENNNKTMQRNLFSDLYSVFGDLADIEIIFLSESSDDEQIIADAILILRPSMIAQIENKIDDLSKVIVVTRSILQDSIYELYNIPKDLKVLVVNDSIETTNDTISMFYRLNITHLNFIPYIPNETDLTEIKIAVTPGEARFVPKAIPRIIDIGNRKLDIETFLDLIGILGIKNDDLQKRLLRYVDENLMLSKSIKNRYIKNYVLTESLQQIIDVNKSGFILTDSDYNIEYYNLSISNILDGKIEKDSRLSTYFDEREYKKLINEENTLLTLNGIQVIGSKSRIHAMEQITGWCFIFDKVTAIRNANDVLSKKLKQEGLEAKYTFDDILYKCEKMKKMIEYAKKVAKTDYTVLITGETGTGKEMVAQSIHNDSNRKEFPFVAINCAALPDSLLESELFGYEEGAFTGAKKGGKIGLFEKATGGTIFLDELCEMPLMTQAKLLRVLQERQIMRVGGTSFINIDVRVIVATNAFIKEKIINKEFREDLYYRVNTFKIPLIPLREREEDVLIIFRNMLKTPKAFSEKMKNMLLNHYWKGNVRELRNVADYYEVMDNLDILIENSFVKLTKEENGQSNNMVRDDVLRIIVEREKRFLTNGRMSIFDELKNNGIEITYTRLEKSIEELIEMGMIVRKKGRGGISSTELGRKEYK